MAVSKSLTTSSKFSMNERHRNAAWEDYITFGASILQLFLAAIFWFPQ
jgi:hypothetical protein